MSKYEKISVFCLLRYWRAQGKHIKPRYLRQMHDTRKTFSSEKIKKKFILLDKLYVRSCVAIAYLFGRYTTKLLVVAFFWKCMGEKKWNFFIIFFLRTFGMIISTKICAIEKSIDVNFFYFFRRRYRFNTVSHTLIYFLPDIFFYMIK